MTISNEAYKALEDVVGQKNITREPAELDSYCFVWANELLVGNWFSVRPLAVVMPKNTTEVQEIVRLCNRFKIKFKAHSSGFGPGGITGHKPFVSIDLRRMDKIIEIDEKNKVALVEPYVSQWQLFLAARQYGLRPLMTAVGPSCTVLPTVTANLGTGTSNISADYGGRNFMGCEWVQPDGSLTSIGSVASTGKWFSGDGPGPALRGTVRGWTGAMGGNGVFTKAAVKLYPWYSDQETKLEGEGPFYNNKIPDNFEMWLLYFPDQKSILDFTYLVSEAEIAYSFQKIPPGLIPAFNVKSNEELHDMLKSIPEMIEAIGTKGCSLSVDASSKEELAYKVKVMEKIMEETNAMEMPLDDQTRGLMMTNIYNGAWALKSVFNPAGGFMITHTMDEAMDAVSNNASDLYEEVLEPLRQDGQLFEAYKYPKWEIGPFSDGAGHSETLLVYDSADLDNAKRIAEAVGIGHNRVPEIKMGVNNIENNLGFNGAPLKAAMKHNMLDYPKYMLKVKEKIDPLNLSESSSFIDPDTWEEED